MDRKRAATSFISSSVGVNKRYSYLSQQQRAPAHVTAKQQLQRLISSAPTRATSEHKISASARVFPSSERSLETTSVLVYSLTLLAVNLLGCSSVSAVNVNVEQLRSTLIIVRSVISRLLIFDSADLIQYLRDRGYMDQLELLADHMIRWHSPQCGAEDIMV